MNYQNINWESVDYLVLRSLIGIEIADLEKHFYLEKRIVEGEEYLIYDLVDFDVTFFVENQCVESITAYSFCYFNGLNAIDMNVDFFLNLIDATVLNIDNWELDDENNDITSIHDLEFHKNSQKEDLMIFSKFGEISSICISAYEDD
jgi:hypothetical protein